MSGMFRWLQRPTPIERLARHNLRPDTLAAAAAMVSDPRSDAQVIRLESSLRDSETVLQMVDARFEGEMGLLVLTSERVLFRARFSRGQLGFDVELGSIAAIEGSTRKVLGTVRLTTAEGGFTVDRILGNQGETLAERARGAMRGDRPRRDPLELLAELRALRDSGAISQSEFDERKAAVWGDI